jgi:hypothetical protein
MLFTPEHNRYVAHGTERRAKYCAMYFIRISCEWYNRKVTPIPTSYVNSGFCAHILRTCTFLLERFSVLRYRQEENTIFCTQDLERILTSKLIYCLMSFDKEFGLSYLGTEKIMDFCFRSCDIHSKQAATRILICL